MSASYLLRQNAPAIAYIKQEGKNPALPTVVFLHGFHSDMRGSKAQFLADECAKTAQSYLRFDYSGHGESEGDFKDGTIGQWMNDAIDAIDELTHGKLILVGSSMGGWIGLLAALARKDRIAGFIGLAAAPDFTKWMRKEFSAAQKEMLAHNGYFLRESDYGDPYPITLHFLEDGNDYCLLEGPIDLDVPVRLVQGMVDVDVPWQTAQKIADKMTGQDKEVYLQEDGDHRLSREEDLALLARLVRELSGGQS